jgi:8-amino-7-oxononanoate synthase
VDDAHGFGVIGERGGYDPSPYGRRGNGIVRWFGESYDHVVLAAGFSRAYSSLLAFVAVPPQLKQFLKVMAPTYMYGGPVPVASNVSGFPLVELALADPEDLHPVGRHLFDRGVYVTLAPIPWCHGRRSASAAPIREAG